jgi:LCP family protein required for cell wall assembly
VEVQVLESRSQRNKKKKVITRVVVIALICILVLGAAGYYYTTYFFNNIVNEESPSVNEPKKPDSAINVLLVGVADGMSDTIMLCNYNPNTDETKIISIPRDTYYPRPNYNKPAQKKINAVYGAEGIDGLVRSVTDLTGVEINYYWKFDYDAVEAIVDAIGGVEYTIPYNMNYDDEPDDLHIHFAKGTVISKGSDIVKALRWRKNNENKGGYAEGDIGRIKTQHEIIKAGLNKLFSNIAINAIKIQKPIMEHVKTNMPSNKIIFYLGKLNGVNIDNISFGALPGEAKDMEGLSFFIADKEAMKELFSSFSDNVDN